MSDFSRIESSIRRAHLARSAALGELIATGVVAAWNGISRFATAIAATAREQKPARPRVNPH
jgi:hypothetical protein